MRKIGPFFFICMALIMGFKAFGADQNECTPVDLRAFLGPVRQQGNIGWCYANAAADLIDYEYREELHGEQVSAISIALNFNYNLSWTNFSLPQEALGGGGGAFEAVKLYLQEGHRACLQTVDDQLKDQGFHFSFKEKMETINLLKSAYDQYHQDPSPQSSQWKWAHFFQIWEYLKKHDSPIFTIGNQRLMNLLSTSSYREFPKKIVEALCEKNSVPLKEKSYLDALNVLRAWSYRDSWITGSNFASENHVMSVINQQLSRKNIIGIAYYHSILTSTNAAVDTHKSHLSIIAGRLWNEQAHQCEYLIRNSWGENCDSYKDSIILRNACESGNVWVPENLIRKAILGITYFKK